MLRMHCVSVSPTSLQKLFDIKSHGRKEKEMGDHFSSYSKENRELFCELKVKFSLVAGVLEFPTFMFCAKGSTFFLREVPATVKSKTLTFQRTEGVNISRQWPTYSRGISAKLSSFV